MVLNKVALVSLTKYKKTSVETEEKKGSYIFCNIYSCLLASMAKILVTYDLYHVSESVRKGICTEERGAPTACRLARTNALTNDNVIWQNGSYGNQRAPSRDSIQTLAFKQPSDYACLQDVEMCSVKKIKVANRAS